MDTITAAITPLISSPVIVIRISGEFALKSFEAMLLPNGEKVDATTLLHNYVHRYKFLTLDGLSDDVLAVYFKAPKSFTGEDVVEISFHGNPLLVRSAFSTLYSLGIRDAMPGEFSKRAFLNGKIDLTQAEAIQELIAAKTTKGVFHAYEQLAGSVRAELDGMKTALLDIKADVEAIIDFPDEDTVDHIFPKLRTSFSSVLLCSKSLLESYQGLRLKSDKVSIVIAGKPNAGKSSLLNSLLKQERAIVSPVAGTTRDFVQEDIYLGDFLAEIVDTAGVRQSDDDIETAGIQKTFEKVAGANLVLVVLDMSAEQSSEDDVILAKTDKLERIIVGNKSDKCGELPHFVDIVVSAKTGFNLDKLKSMIKSRISLFDRTDDSANTVPVTERHYFLLCQVVECLETLLLNLDCLALDMVAFDIDFCLNKFSEITGESYTEEVLDIIFSKFCIGK